MGIDAACYYASNAARRSLEHSTRRTPNYTWRLYMAAEAGEDRSAGRYGYNTRTASDVYYTDSSIERRAE